MNSSELKKTTPNKKITLLKKADFVSLKPELKHLKKWRLKN